MSRLRPLLLIASLGLAVACSDDQLIPVGEPDDDDASDDDDAAPDDDDAAPDDDDDDAPPGVDAVTFAASLDGVSDTGEDDVVRTRARGMFHVLYWAPDIGGPACRFEHEIMAYAQVDDVVNVGCRGCVGVLEIESSGLREVKGPQGCRALPAEVDVGFLLGQGDDAPPDFRSIRLVSAEALRGRPAPLGESLDTSQVRAAYEGAGFEVLYFGLVSPEGWLAQDAGLADTALPWDETDDLPMFVLYRPLASLDEGPLVGEWSIGGLWTVDLSGDG